MKKAERSHTRWFTAWRTRERVAAPLDPADCGTAFGLELSMQPDAAGPVPTRRSGAPRPSWRRRLAGRSGPSAI